MVKNSNLSSSIICKITCIIGKLIKESFTYYPDCGELKFKLLFNRNVQFRLHAKKGDVKDLHVLFCREGDINPAENSA